MLNIIFCLDTLTATASLLFLDLNILRCWRYNCTGTSPLHGSSLGF